MKKYTKNTVGEKVPTIRAGASPSPFFGQCPKESIFWGGVLYVLVVGLDWCNPGVWRWWALLASVKLSCRIFIFICYMDLSKLIDVFLTLCQTKPSWSLTKIFKLDLVLVNTWVHCALAILMFSIRISYLFIRAIKVLLFCLYMVGLITWRGSENNDN